jgi:hypothetical protein
MNLYIDDKHLDETADRPPLSPEPVSRRGNDGKSKRPPPSDKLVYGRVIQPGVPPAPPEPLLNPEPAD